MEDLGEEVEALHRRLTAHGGTVHKRSSEMNLTFINTLQTVLTVVNVVVIALLTQVGCIDNPATPEADLMCTVSNVPFLSVTLLGWLAAGSNTLKLVILPMLAPGGWIRNLFGAKAVVAPVTSSAAVPGTVSPADVR